MDGKRWTGLDPAYRLQAVLGAGAYGCPGARAGYPESADEASHRARRIRRCGVERMRLALKMDSGYRHAQQPAGFDAKWPIRREECARARSQERRLDSAPRPGWAAPAAGCAEACLAMSPFDKARGDRRCVCRAEDRRAAAGGAPAPALAVKRIEKVFANDVNAVRWRVGVFKRASMLFVRARCCPRHLRMVVPSLL